MAACILLGYYTVLFHQHQHRGCVLAMCASGKWLPLVNLFCTNDRHRTKEVRDSASNYMYQESRKLRHWSRLDGGTKSLIIRLFSGDRQTPSPFQNYRMPH
jgi:hypothetical protein